MKSILITACLAGLSTAMAQTPTTPEPPPPPGVQPPPLPAAAQPQSAPSNASGAGYLGISTAPVPPPVSAQLKLDPGFGLLVVGVVPDSPAAQAGISANEVLVKLDDQLLIEPNQLSTLVRSRKPGDSVALTAIKGGEQATVTVKLGERPARMQTRPTSVFTLPLPDGFMAGNVEINGDNVVVSGGSSVTVVVEGGKKYQLIRVKDEKTFIVTADQGGDVLFTKTLKDGDDASGIPEEFRKTFERMDRDAPVRAMPGPLGPGTGFGKAPESGAVLIQSLQMADDPAPGRPADVFFQTQRPDDVN